MGSSIVFLKILKLLKLHHLLIKGSSSGTKVLTLCHMRGLLLQPSLSTLKVLFSFAFLKICHLHQPFQNMVSWLGLLPPCFCICYFLFLNTLFLSLLGLNNYRFSFSSTYAFLLLGRLFWPSHPFLPFSISRPTTLMCPILCCNRMPRGFGLGWPLPSVDYEFLVGSNFVFFNLYLLTA